MWYLWLVFVAALLWHRRHLYKLSWELRGPFAWPLLGNILSLWNEDGAHITNSTIMLLVVEVLFGGSGKYNENHYFQRM